MQLSTCGTFLHIFIGNILFIGNISNQTNLSAESFAGANTSTTVALFL